jgi:RNA polymerase sigma-70 factor (ECF subfamily)
MARVPKTEALSLPQLGKTLAGGSIGEVRAQEDRELVRRAQKDDKQAFEELVRRHQNRVFAVAGGILRSREDVEDIAQQVFLKAYFSIKRFDQRAAFSTWLYKITVNECWDMLRKKKVRPLVLEAELSEEQAQVYQASSEQSDGKPDTSEQMAAREQVEELISCLEQRDRSMLVLKEVEGFSVEEIAEIMGINANTVKVRLFRARQKITERVRRRRNAERRAE